MTGGDSGPGLGARLLRLRERRGLTQKQLADRAGVHQATVCRFESGGRTPSLAVLSRLAHALGARPADLLP